MPVCVVNDNAVNIPETVQTLIDIQCSVKVVPLQGLVIGRADGAIQRVLNLLVYENVIHQLLNFIQVLLHDISRVVDLAQCGFDTVLANDRIRCLIKRCPYYAGADQDHAHSEHQNLPPQTPRAFGHVRYVLLLWAVFHS